ncbi:hypothetical protein BX070DRAFT_234904 [Coemansia spiralis]|nr:hypothetical protein BX070DRAFT_234904 [Coemansia spiralis]
MALADEDFYYPRDLEASFCRDFSCCGLILNDLHDLLQHYEECHVRFEDDEAQPDLGDDCFFDEEWAPVSNCLTSPTAAHTASVADLTSFGLSLEQQLILSAATTATATSTAVPSPELSAKDNLAAAPASTLLHKTAGANLASRPRLSTPPLSPSNTASSSVINSPHEAAMPYPIDTAMASRKRSAAVSVAASPEPGEQSPIKRRVTFSNASNPADDALSAAVSPTMDLAFPNSVLGLYDDDIIAAIASATDPLFLSGAAAAAAAANGHKSNKSNNSRNSFAAATNGNDIVATSASLAEAATAAVNAVTFEDSEDCIHLPPSVTAAMAGAVAAAAAAKAHGLLPRDDKPYRCPISGCDKAYKNPNGLKYHNLHGHCNMAEETQNASKPYRCRVPECYKAYKNLNGLKYHVQHAHCAMIPSIRDLPPNASPAEVAAAVAAAAAAAAAAASSSSSSVLTASTSAASTPATSPLLGSKNNSSAINAPATSQALRSVGSISRPSSMQQQTSSSTVPSANISLTQNRPAAASTSLGPRMTPAATTQSANSNTTNSSPAASAVRKGPVATNGNSRPNALPLRTPQQQHQLQRINSGNAPISRTPGPRLVQPANRRPQPLTAAAPRPRPANSTSATSSISGGAHVQPKAATSTSASQQQQQLVRRPPAQGTTNAQKTAPSSPAASVAGSAQPPRQQAQATASC